MTTATGNPDATTRPTSDVTKDCVDCGTPFTLRYGERLFFWRNLLPEPKRCGTCRAKNRAGRPRVSLKAQP